MSDAFRERLRRLRREAPEGAPAPPPAGADALRSRTLAGAAPGEEPAEAPNTGTPNTGTPGTRASNDVAAGAGVPAGSAGPAPPATPSSVGLPPWLRARLGRGAAPERAVGVASGPPAGLVARAEGGAERVTRFPLAHRHGDWALAATLDVDPEVLALVGRDPALADLDPSRAVYLDIETTGLSGGAGTWPFLVALGRFVDDHFELWQGFLTGPEDEPGLLAEVARRIDAAGRLVTFFGKSFDRHRLEDKMRVCGVRPPFEGRPHLDLYHVCRRLYGEGTVDGRLQTMERALCGVTRSDDLPGSMAPAAWFDFLAGRAHRLEDVFRHNLDDVLSLATLTAHVGRTLDERAPDGGPLAGPSAPRARGTARLFAARREHARAAAWHAAAVERLAALGLTTAAREERLLEARELERAGEGEGARAAYLTLGAGDDPTAVRALERLALLDERRGALGSARDHARRGLALATRRLPGGARDPLARALAERLARLDARSAR